MSDGPPPIDALARQYLAKVRKGGCRTDAQHALDCRADGGTSDQCRRYDVVFSRCIVEEVCPDQYSAFADCVDKHKPLGNSEYVRRQCHPHNIETNSCLEKQLSYIIK